MKAPSVRFPFPFLAPLPTQRLVSFQPSNLSRDILVSKFAFHHGPTCAAYSQVEYDHPEKGDALYAFELSLSLEKLNNDRLIALHRVAEAVGLALFTTSFCSKNTD